MADVAALPRRYTEEETADAIGVSLSALRGLERARKIRAFRPTPRKVYYLDRDIIDFIERSRTPWPDATTTSSGSPLLPVPQARLPLLARRLERPRPAF